MTNLEIWIINSIMLCNAEEKWIKDSALNDKQRKKQIAEQTLQVIKDNYSESVKDIFIAIEKRKAVDRFLKAKFQDVDCRATKIIYYLRNFYRHRAQQKYDVIPRYILNMLCGYDPKDEDFYKKILPTRFTHLVSCVNKCTQNVIVPKDILTLKR